MTGERDSDTTPSTVDTAETLQQTNNLLQNVLHSFSASTAQSMKSNHITWAKAVQIDPFDIDKHQPNSWFYLFSSRVTSLNVPAEYYWPVFCHSLESPEAVIWAADLQENCKQTLASIKTAFLSEFGHATRQIDEAKIKLNNAKQGEESPRAFSRDVVYKFRELHDISPGVSLTPDQEKIIISIVRNGLKPHIADRVWTSRASSLEEILSVATDAAAAPDYITDPNIEKAINSLSGQIESMQANMNIMQQQIHDTGSMLSTQFEKNIARVGNTPPTECAPPVQQLQEQHSEISDPASAKQPHTGRAKYRRRARNRANVTNAGNMGRLCLICQSPDHLASSCVQRIKPKMCVICREMDHKHNECPQNPYRTVPVTVPHQPILLPSNQPNVCEYCFESGHTVHQCQQIVP